MELTSGPKPITLKKRWEKMLHKVQGGGIIRQNFQKESLLFTNDTPVNFPSKIISRSLFPFAANPDITFPFPVLRIVSTAQTHEAKQIK
jgi:hypothetical protein